MQDGQFGNDEYFNNRNFRKKRYIDNPVLGSGIGSRGENLLHKRAIVTKFLKAMRPESVLDIGCGDLEVLREIEFNARYIGIDVSEAIVRFNTSKFVDKTFFCIDFASTLELNNFIFDHVLCLDVPYISTLIMIIVG